MERAKWSVSSCSVEAALVFCVQFMNSQGKRTPPAVGLSVYFNVLVVHCPLVCHTHMGKIIGTPLLMKETHMVMEIT